MSDSRNGCERIRGVLSSRHALALGAVAGGAAATRARAAEDQPGRRQVSAAAEGGQQCDDCVHFQAPNACKLVQGNIGPSGWCQLLPPKPK